MPKCKAPRKKYTPRPVLANPLSYVLTGFKPIRKEDADRIKIISHGSMYALTTGTATRADWDFICNALNIAIVLAELGVGDEYTEQIKSAMIAHAQCGKRLLQGGALGYTGEQMAVVNLALEIHDAQVDIATESYQRMIVQDEALEQLRLDLRDAMKLVRESTSMPHP